MPHSLPEFYKKMKKVLPCLNLRIVTFVYALAAARRLLVRVSFLPNLENNGYYIPPEASYDNRAQIYINSSISEARQARAIVHELTHHCNHVALNVVLMSRETGTTSALEKQEKFRRSKSEYEAEIIESISAIPAKDLKNANGYLFESDDEDTKGVWLTRQIAREKHRL